MDATHATASTLPATPTRGGGPTDPSHDANLRRGILDTDVARPIAIGLTALFLLLIYGVPLGQIALEKLNEDDSSLLALFERAPTRENLRLFEKEIEQASIPKEYVQPRMQLLLSRAGRAGNKRALIGKAGYLYYVPGLTHLAGPSFVDADAIRDRKQQAREGDDGSAIEADPRPAIFALHDMLAKRGIRLVLFPVPDKAMLQPLELHGRGDASQPRPVGRNLGWGDFVAQLNAHGVALFDPAPAQLKPGEAPRYLIQDTHWTPIWMRAVAGELAKFVTRLGVLPAAAPSKTWRAVAQPVERVGDIVDMLKLPDEQTLFRPQSATVYQVQDEHEQPWEPDPDGDVLLLGDSFTNVFSMDTMGWGEAAGLGPTLALALGRGVDVIAQNDSGAFATRIALSRALAAGEDRLAGKKVVIWEFASRELSVGDWKTIDWEVALRQGATAR